MGLSDRIKSNGNGSTAAVEHPGQAVLGDQSLSTQPPETDPANSPASETASLEPSGLGAERLVATTVASAARRPSPLHFSIASSASPLTYAAYRPSRSPLPAD